jgi:hypothetical protein
MHKNAIRRITFFRRIVDRYLRPAKTGMLSYRFENMVNIMSDSEKTTQLFTYEHDARRLELLVRIFYSIAIAIVMLVYGFIAGILMFIQWFVILILGHRNEGLSDFIRGYLEYHVHVLSYIYWQTDIRPGVMPKSVKVFEEVAPEQ